MAVKIKGTFKKESNEFNGLEAIADEMGDNPTERFVVVGTVERHKREEQDGTTTVTARFVQIEPLHGDEADTAKRAMEKAFTERTGAQPAPPTLFDKTEPSAEELMAERAEAKAAQGEDEPPWDEGAPAVTDAHPPKAEFVEPGMDKAADGSPDDLDAKRSGRKR